MGDERSLGHSLNDPEAKLTFVSANRELLKREYKGWIEFGQSSLGQISRIKEQAKNDPELQDLCREIISMELSFIKFLFLEINSSS